jgi:hypothetical protein
MDEVASLCDRVILLLDGTMRYYGAPDVEGHGNTIESLLQLFEAEAEADEEDEEEVR